MCARIIVISPRSTPIVMKKSMRPMAVTISGFMIGKSLICSTRSFTTLRDLESPTAAKVPVTVDTTVAMTATRTVV